MKKIIIIILIVLLVGLGGTYVLLNMQMNKKNPKPPEQNQQDDSSSDSSGNNSDPDDNLDPNKEYRIVSFDRQNGEAVQKVYVEIDNPISRPQPPEKDGYKFIEWQNNGKAWNFETKITENLMLKAKWELLTYTIKYNLDGGEFAEIAPETYTVEQTVRIPQPTKTDSVFIGWTYKRHSDAQTDVVLEHSWGNLVFTAHWESHHTINFDSKNGDPIQTVVLEGNFSVAEPPQPTKTGYRFNGWYCDGALWDFDTIVLKDMTLTAHWSLAIYKIKYANLKTQIDANPSSYTVNDTFTLTNPNEAGRTFIGWTYEGQDTPQLHVTIQNYSGDLTFTAHWADDPTP